MSILTHLVAAMCGCGFGIVLLALFVVGARADECESERVIEAYRRGYDARRAQSVGAFSRGIAFGRTLGPVVHRHYVVDAPTFDRLAQRGVKP